MTNQQSVTEALRRSVRDPHEFSLVYAEHAEALLAYLTRRVFDADTALDLTAETFARAFLNRRRFRGATDAEVAGWIFAIAQRELASYFRRRKVERRALRRLGLQVPAIDSEDEARILELAGIDRLRSAVRAELEQLSAPQRDALRLRVVDELSYEAVADRLGISQQAARARVARGLRALARSLDRSEPSLKEAMTP